jgi:PAS domain S-box-containing protein
MQDHILTGLQKSEARFRAMFESAGIGIALVGMDRRPIEANAAMIEMTGYSPEEFFKMSGADLSYPGDADIGIPELMQVLEGKLNTYQIEKRYIRKNGQVYWVRLTNSVVRGTDGQPEYFVTIVEDINEQKEMQERIRESDARFQAIFDNVAVGVAVMTLDRRPVTINAMTEKITGYNFNELKDVDPRSLVLPEDRDMDTEWYSDLTAGRRESYVMERRYRHKDGHIFWARINYSLVRDMDGNPDYLVGIIEDIDDQKRSNERLAQQEADYLLKLQKNVAERTRELEEANQRLQQEIEQRIRIEKELAEKAAEDAVTADRTRLARDLHDAVTQTLFSASLTAEVLPDLWEMDVEEAEKSTEELRQLTRGALAEMRTLLLELRPATLAQTRLSDLIKQLCEAFIGRSRLPIVLNIEGDSSLPPEVQIAFYRIAQESLNNVFKYARASTVNVNLFISESSVHFEVCDNGIGFDMSTGKPTSMGLRIMRERAEAIGADFHIDSTPGSGTCVEVTWNKNSDFKLRVL